LNKPDEFKETTIIGDESVSASKRFIIPGIVQDYPHRTSGATVVLGNARKNSILPQFDGFESPIQKGMQDSGQYEHSRRLGILRKLYRFRCFLNLKTIQTSRHSKKHQYFSCRNFFRIRHLHKSFKKQKNKLLTIKRD
jgi:hypothetical protein